MGSMCKFKVHINMRTMYFRVVMEYMLAIIPAQYEWLPMLISRRLPTKFLEEREKGYNIVGYGIVEPLNAKF